MCRNLHLSAKCAIVVDCAWNWESVQKPRGVAQFGSAPALGAGCRRFESCHPDHEPESLTRVFLFINIE